METIQWLLLVSVGAALLLGYLWARATGSRSSISHKLNALERKAQNEAEERAQVEGNFRDVVEHCGAGVLRIDADLNVVFSNEEASNIVGHGIQGRPLIQALLSDELHASVRRALENGQPHELELREIGADKRTLQTRVFPSEAGDGALLFLHDVTDVRYLETVRRDFVANVSHELRTPLASIRAMAETLSSGAADEKATTKRFLGMIVSEADRLARIADDLLSLTRAESVVPTRERFDLSQLMSEMLARFASRAKKARVLLESHIPEGIEFSGNRDQIEEAVVNLMENAIKFSPEQGTVTVSLERSGGNVAIAIADTGIGILQEDVPRIFERFYRVDKARSRQTGGTGLGLSIVKHVAEAHRGSVQVESEFNRGSTFTLLLPDSERT